MVLEHTRTKHSVAAPEAKCSHVLYAPFCAWHKDSPARQMRSVSVARPRDSDPDAGSEREQPGTRDALN
jgi:hypothetical protein